MVTRHLFFRYAQKTASCVQESLASCDPFWQKELDVDLHDILQLLQDDGCKIGKHLRSIKLLYLCRILKTRAELVISLLSATGSFARPQYDYKSVFSMPHQYLTL